MGHLLGCIISNALASSEKSKALARIPNRFCQFKKCTFSDTLHSGSLWLSVAPRENASSGTMVAQGPIHLAWIGTWSFKHKIFDTATLIAYYQKEPTHLVSRHLDGAFALWIFDRQRQESILITDRNGSRCLFWHRDHQDNIWISSSSAVFPNCTLDPLGVYEFLSHGTLYDNRTLWQEVEKLPAASITRISHQYQAKIEPQKYWDLSQVALNSLSLPTAIEQLKPALHSVLGQISLHFPKIAADLTGGYDSRWLHAHLEHQKIAFTSTVNGPSQHPDVQVAREIALKMNYPLVVLNAQEHPSQLLDRAVRYTDGEFDAFLFANITQIHSILSDLFDISLNGSFGELGRGYWWPLWQNTSRQNRPLNLPALIKKHFLFESCVQAWFGNHCPSFDQHMQNLLQKTLNSGQQLPLFAQLDRLYLMLRMQHWQGRITSSTNQIWPALSPFGFSEVLDVQLATQWSARQYNQLPRHVLSELSPRLANINTSAHYPPCTITWKNWIRFAPLSWFYGKKIVQYAQNTIRPNRTILQMHHQILLDQIHSLSPNSAHWLIPHECPELVASAFASKAFFQDLLHSASPALLQRIWTLESLLRIRKQPAP